MEAILSALNRTAGLYHRLPSKNLFESFQVACRPSQVFIQQPDVCALIYSKNDKLGSYCGFFKEIPKNHPFDQEAFLSANALPGPDSKIYCIL